ncbi:DUF2971 domain-containing protein [Amaricoccus solimangrovi]|uniref:DUF2971 domain-containing protein n=2 Tax=Amaricoccus solimangrovi TaxID=2589815 RepID=A0A501WGU3_9RHOB|nr:DUF2971 domain-containing protein [Amaricoccus solimangrovi]
MWKIYGSPGAGVAVVTNGGRLEAALSSNPESLYLGAIRYVAPGTIEFGNPNSFDTILVKRASYAYEKEVRLVYWDTNNMHDSLESASWNETTMRFDGIVEKDDPPVAGRSFDCDVDVLIKRVVVSPFAPPWYLPMIERLREQLNLHFPITASRLLAAPPIA